MEVQYFAKKKCIAGKSLIFFPLFIGFHILYSQVSANKISLSDWMSQTLDQSKTLKDITIPGAHDASIFQCFDCTVGANIKNTQTQYLPIETLLDSGIRYFDLRPIWDEGQFFTGHYTNYNKRPSFGCKGDTMKRILNSINKFLDQHKELVILHFSHYNDRTWKKENKNFLPALLKLFEDCLGDKIFVLRDTTKRFSEIQLKDFFSNEKGKVILLINDFRGNPVSNQSKGFFSNGKDLMLFDKYSNTTDFNFMSSNQKEKFSTWSKKDTLKREELFVMPWTLTQNAKTAMRCSGFKMPWKKCISIMEYADIAKKNLVPYFNNWINEGLITKKSKPNIVNADIADGLVTRLCLLLNSL